MPLPLREEADLWRRAPEAGQYVRVAEEGMVDSHRLLRQHTNKHAVGETASGLRHL